MVERRRTLRQRFRYARILECPACEGRRVQAHTDVHPLLSLTARCPKCSTQELRVRKRLDPYDPVYRNPISLMQRYLGARLMYCVDCRLQFYDLRPRRKIRRG